MVILLLIFILLPRQVSLYLRAIQRNYTETCHGNGTESLITARGGLAIRRERMRRKEG